MNLNENSTRSPIKVTFLSDSICVGQGVSIYQGWVIKVAKDLDDYGQKINREILVSNSSINGRTTRQALEDMPYHIQSQGVDILVVQFGLNDCNYWVSDRGLPRVSLPAFVANLREIIARGRRFGACRILLNNNHPTSQNKSMMPNSPMTYEASNTLYNAAMRELAVDLPPFVLFQDIEAHFKAIPDKQQPTEPFLLSDGLHLSAKGHELYYQLMYPIIQNAVDAVIKEETGF